MGAIIKSIRTMTLICLWLYIYICESNIGAANGQTTILTAPICSTTTNHDVSCYNIETDDDLPPIQNHRFHSTKQHIYFHETTCNGCLNSRQACVVESAARLHPDWQINVAFSAPMNTSSRAKLGTIQEFSNVQLWRVNVLKFLQKTPLEYLITKGHLKNSSFAIFHAADVLRSATLYNWDGVYIDLDLLIVKPLDGLAQNFGAREDYRYISNSILALSSDEVGRSIAKELMWEIATTFNGQLFSQNGPLALTRVMRRRCKTKNASKMSRLTCNGFEVYGPSYFFPTHWLKGHKYFEPGNLSNNLSYGYHFWNKMTNNLIVENSSTIAQLAQKYCPFSYQLYKAEFGFKDEQT